MAYGTIKADVIQSDTANVPPQFNGGNGVQVGTLCRAWVNFNGTGTVAIRASFNVSSITDNGTGDYTVNFTTALPDANYAPAALLNGGSAGGSVMAPYSATVPTTTAYRIGTRRTDTFVATDTEYVNIAFFR